MNETEREAGFAGASGSAVWLIQRLWTDNLENEASAASGYRPEGFAEREEDADRLVTEAGYYTGNCWAVPESTPMRRKLKLPRLTPDAAARSHLKDLKTGEPIPTVGPGETKV